MSAFDTQDDWIEYALSMADDAGKGGRDLTLVATRLDGLSLEASVADRLRTVVQRQEEVGEDDVSRASRALFGELAHWLLEFMVAASYVRQERGLLEEELSFAIKRWFSRLGTELSESECAALTNSILVKSLLNDAKPFVVARTSARGISLVEAPLLVRVEHGRYRVTDEAENYLYHLDSTIDSFASDYTLVAARMGRELDSRSYGKSSHTVMEMVATVGHVRLLMSALVDETGRLGPDVQSERYEVIRRSVEEIRRGDEVERRYQEEVNRIWEGWSSGEEMDLIRETKGDRLADLRSLGEGLRVLSAAKSWMYDEYATLSERCEEVTRHYLRSSIVTTLFSLDDLMDEVAHANLRDVGWLDALLLPATRMQPDIGFSMPSMVTLDDMFERVSSDETRPAVDLEALLEGDEELEVPDDTRALDLARDFAQWLASGGGTLEDLIALRSPEQLYVDMESYDLARLVSSLLVGMSSNQATTSVTDGGRDGREEQVESTGQARLSSFADASWLREVLPAGADGLQVAVRKTGAEAAYLGSADGADVVGTLEDVRFEVTVDA